MHREVLFYILLMPVAAFLGLIILGACLQYAYHGPLDRDLLVDVCLDVVVETHELSEEGAELYIRSNPTGILDVCPAARDLIEWRNPCENRALFGAGMGALIFTVIYILILAMRRVLGRSN